MFDCAAQKKDLEGTLLEGLDHPLLETDEQWAVYGFTYPNYLATLGDAGQTTVARRLRWTRPCATPSASCGAS